jgi:hypothetical protein
MCVCVQIGRQRVSKKRLLTCWTRSTRYRMTMPSTKRGEYGCCLTSSFSASRDKRLTAFFPINTRLRFMNQSEFLQHVPLRFRYSEYEMSVPQTRTFAEKCSPFPRSHYDICIALDESTKFLHNNRLPPVFGHRFFGYFKA